MLRRPSLLTNITCALAACALACGGDPKPSPGADMSAPADMGALADTPADMPSAEDMPADLPADMPIAQDMTPAQDMPAEDMAVAQPASLQMRLSRGADRQILIEVSALDAEGQRIDAPALAIEAPVGELSATTLDAAGRAHATLTPPAALIAGSITIRATLPAPALTVEREALVFAQLADAWDQPEAVPGLVNTPGWEDSVEISPDGQWLIVSTYSPINLFGCQLSGQRATPPVPYGLTDAPECNAAVGPYDAPARPGMPGADRILSDRVQHACPSVGLVDPSSPTGEFFLALPPVSAYGFKRQPDGSFAEPFPIAFQADGCTTAPFGLTFPEGSFDASSARVVLAFDDYRNDGGDTGNDLFVVDGVALGAPVVLGTYSAQGGVTATGFRPVRLDLPDAGGEGNPFVTREGVFFDNEGASEVGIYFSRSGADLSGALPARERVGLSAGGAHDYQPFVFDDRLYYARDFQQLRSAAWTDRARVDASAFAGDGVEIQAGSPLVQDAGAILSVGEPSLARDADGTVWLYFVYGVRAADGSVNQSVGRVRRRG